MSQKSIEEVYEDRNALAQAFARMAHEAGYGVGFYIHDEWAVVNVELPQGQVSWHMRPEDVLDWVSQFDPVQFDGHDRDEKNRRLLAFAGGDR